MKTVFYKIFFVYIAVFFTLIALDVIYWMFY